MLTNQLLIIGAGPYGLATAAYAKQLGIDYAILGKPMEFWRDQMPKGMLLRSSGTGHLDPMEIYTLQRYLASKDIKREPASPLPLSLFVEYADWLVEQVGIKALHSFVRQLEYRDGHFEAFIENGETLSAENVVTAPGFGMFRHLPADLTSKFPQGRYSHTCAMVNFEPLAGRRCLVMGGRQSAFEWTALMVEAGVAQVHVSFRHETPRFAPSDWDWVDPLMERTLEIRGWFRNLPKAEREAIERRFQEEGLLKVEPGLAPRISKYNVKLWPHSDVDSCKVLADGTLHVRLSGGAHIDVDHVILATGYQVDVQQVPYFSKTTILPRLKTSNGFPALDEYFQSSVPGLYVTGLAATRDFGPFYGMVRGCPSSAKIIGDHIQSRMS
ncbi:MAG: NAD(P)-binding domain-containing protein [Terriglobia bacterium]|jgi:cation diffusion facilitator CzcD-associated flavoprotein CzcO